MYPKLDLYPTSQLIKLEWIRYANDEIVAFYHTWLPGSYGQLLFDEDLEHKNIYEILEEKYEIPITAGSYIFSAMNANKEIAQHMGLGESNAFICIE